MGIVVTDPDRRWLGRYIPYVINKDDFPLNSPQRQEIEKARDFWNARSPVRLEPLTDEIDYVMFREAGAVLRSPIGRQGGVQYISCDIGGSELQIIPDQWSRAAPALASFGGKLHMVHLGQSSNVLWYSYYDGTKWKENVQVPDLQSNAPAALAGFNGELYMVHINSSPDGMFYSILKGANFEPVESIGPSSVLAPALASFAGRLHLVYVSKNNNMLYHASTSDGVEWEVDDGPLPGKASKAAPALAVHGGRLHLVHLDATTNDLWYSSSSNGVTWTEDGGIQGHQSHATPALASDNVALHMVYLAAGSAELWRTSTTDGMNWETQVRLADESSSASPALAFFKRRVHVVRLGKSSDDMWHSRLDANATRGLTGRILHEICHAAGLEHEQSREDRDSFVHIHLDGIEPDAESNFVRTEGTADSGLYDYGSLMHYGEYGFAKDPSVPVITPGPAVGRFTGLFTRSVVGQRNDFSPGDLDTLHALYPYWTKSYPVPGHESRDTPALAEFNGQLYMVHRGKDSNDLWYSTFDGVWSPRQQVPGQTSSAAVSLAAFDGDLHMVYLAEESNNIYLSKFKGGAWPVERVENQRSQSPPALAAFGGHLHMVYVGEESNDIWHSKYNGTDWLDTRRVEGQTTSTTPALAVLAGRLHMVHRGEESKDLWHSSSDDGVTWSPNVRIQKQTTRGAPALAACDGRLHLVHLGETSDQLWHSIYDGVWRPTSPSFFDGAWRPNVQIEGHLSSTRVGLCAFQDKQLFMVWLKYSSTFLWYSIHTR